eukprot:5501618-Pleurochrysis_carterae.AAC.1
MDHISVAEALAETCYRLGCRGRSPLKWNSKHLLEELDETRMMEAYIKYKLVLGIEGTQTEGRTHEALSKERRRVAPRTGQGYGKQMNLPRVREASRLLRAIRNLGDASSPRAAGAT